MLLGEKAILKEYESIKTKFERKRFSTFGFNLGGTNANNKSSFQMGSFNNGTENTVS